ncbi:MAG: sigma-54-dependent Fis family transcriptional regulator [Deltaproteobacteria bacterium]|nr:sigma-54-dependent Fis family transcriptional regulator [Deltaproteobacteria bacterium]MBW2019334.1 sigma-54-dependent Fis family transcriptional regulator [Deltaproteobacteria bacterium]MBW2074382.1 sigma-54-dependent Fis family transcriptional regulator [Deltaproteobacteria bacterium]RLB82313.1 MAG: sigma-54-dependent Fis family transcriptional regulator [Deltaproteobacteria bacterium]
MILYSIYVVDDEEAIRKGVILSMGKDYQIKAFPTAETAIETIEKDPPDLVLLDIGLPGMSGIDALKEIKTRYPDILVIMITAFEDVKSVISAMKLGAYDYVVKPIQMNAFEVSIRNALETIRLRKEVQSLQEKYLKENLPCFIGESNAIQDVMDFVDNVARSPDTPVLILGETGTGKELIASAIHYKSPNFRGPFVTLNCAAIPKELIESELFGYEKGAFSGAAASGKKGLIEQAAGGTLFLDEVGDLSIEAQAKLLRFLEDGEYYKVGGSKKLSIRTRVVSATNKDLEGMIEEELFRRDLYFRIAVIKVEVPSLNERRDDIIPIARHFLVEFNQKYCKSFIRLSPQAEDALKNYHWKGNVRELRNLVERGVLTGKEPELTLHDLGIQPVSKSSPFNSRSTIRNRQSEMPFHPIPSAGVDLPALHESLDKYYFREALKIAKGNDTKAAQLVNMNYYNFRYRRKKLQIR